jgi:hypothetical protein
MSAFFSSSSLSPVLALLCLPLAAAGEVSAADDDKAARVFRSRVAQEVRKFDRRLRSGAITVEGTTTELYQSGAEKYEFRSVTLSKKLGQHYVAKAEERGPPALARDYCYGINPI